MREADVARGGSSRAAANVTARARDRGSATSLELRDGGRVPVRPQRKIGDDPTLPNRERQGRPHQDVDAQGLLLTPGFVDIHTHYDGQVCWDKEVTPSSWHGITTVVGGNCGFSIAPLTAEAGDYLKRMLARVEGMPLESLDAGVPWDWTSFAEYLARLEGRMAVNAGFLVGHSALRRVVMGADAVGKEATPAQLDAMVELLRTSVAEGGLGFSSSRAVTHNDGDGQPVSRCPAR